MKYAIGLRLIAFTLKSLLMRHCPQSVWMLDSSSNTIVCTHMCQGKMPMSGRERYEKMLSAPIHAPNLEGMIENFDKALSHPDETDLIELKNAASK